jgi:hypothetical protein
MGVRRFDLFMEKHIGLGIRWNTDMYDLHLSISFMCFTVTIGIGKCKC